MARTVKLLIVGGYGTFGGRLIELLEDLEGLTIYVGGRSLHKANAYCQLRTEAKATLLPALFNREQPSAALAAIAPDIVVDASGPFQEYGAGGYSLVEACIAQGANYLDLADAAEFVDGIVKFDAAAKKAGIFVLSGVSSFPVLTVAAVRALSGEMRDIVSVRGGIAPSPYAGVGSNVIRAIAGYSGQPMPIRRDGRNVMSYPLTESLRYTIAPPGKLPLRNILFSLVEVPDLRLLPRQWPGLRDVWMGAGPVPEILHRALNGFAWLVRLRLLKSIAFLAPVMEFVMQRVRWGEHRGGMFIEVSGTGHENETITKSWHLLAEGAHGPLIPSMAIATLIRRYIAGEVIETGARTPELTLADYNEMFAARQIFTGMRDDSLESRQPLYARILGSAWLGLPAEIRAMHDLSHTLVANGRADILCGKGRLARLARGVMGFPPDGKDVPLQVHFAARDGVETWTRDFNGNVFRSRQWAGTGRDDRLVVEKFGPLRFGMAVTAESGRLVLVLRRWSFFGVPLPLALCVRTEAYETVEEGKFVFNVRVWHPLTGPIIHYRGWLVPESP